MKDEMKDGWKKQKITEEQTKEYNDLVGCG